MTLENLESLIDKMEDLQMKLDSQTDWDDSEIQGTRLKLRQLRLLYMAYI